MVNANSKHMKLIATLVIVLALALSCMCSSSAHALERVDIEARSTTGLDRTMTNGEAYERVYEIDSLADPCWIRLSFQLTLNDDVTETVLEEPNGDKWILASDGRWYLTEPVSDRAVFESEFTTKYPDGFLQAFRTGENHEFGELVVIDAIASDSAEPDFTSDDPWYGLYNDGVQDSTEIKNPPSKPSPFPQTGDSLGRVAICLVCAGIAGAILIVISLIRIVPKDDTDQDGEPNSR